MQDTSLSLLNRLRSADSDPWRRLVDLYTPLLRVWLQRYGLSGSDADDVVQEVLLAVSKDIGRFEHAGHPGAFRGWMKSILVNRLRNFWRARRRQPQMAGTPFEDRLLQLEDGATAVSRLWDREHDQYVLRQLLTLAEPNFESTTWQAFCRVALDGATPEEVSSELGISRNAVIVAKCRVLSRLRQESVGLVASSSDFSPNS
ncbi:MAG: sigma-70 family RNA polymerase sigma factor [Planctomycetaceae bacterium]|nr:sigma-70 family RNA polymerase sigma factor [Planctomycetaceae bacterium]